MKSASEWVTEGFLGELAHLSEEDCVKAIQADALRHTLKLLKNYKEKRHTTAILREQIAKLEEE